MPDPRTPPVEATRCERCGWRHCQCPVVATLPTPAAAPAPDVAGLLSALVDEAHDSTAPKATLRRHLAPYLDRARDLGAAQAAGEVADLRARLAEVEGELARVRAPKP